MTQTMTMRCFYNTILSQVFSPCGHYLAVGDIYGYLSIFNLNKILNSDNNEAIKARQPINSFVVIEDVQVNSLLTADDYLIVGTLGEIVGYHWTQLTKSSEARPAWKVEFPSATPLFEKIEVYTMVTDKHHQVLYAGCSDNMVYAIKLEEARIMHKFAGHDNYIHCVKIHDNDLISAGEDGRVILWDMRKRERIHTIEPHTVDEIRRPALGKWMGAVAVNNDWIACGGGPRLSLWHYRTLRHTTVFAMEDKGVHLADFMEDRVFAGGRCDHYYQMLVTGDVVSVVATSGGVAYSAAFQTEPYRALCIAGSSPDIDICTNFNYLDQALTLNYPVKAKTPKSN